MTILLATTSQHKAHEIRELLADLPDVRLETLNDFPATEAPEETGETMAENARLKAEFYAKRFERIVLADDSGLEVDALDGAPGVLSARWAEGSDADRVAVLLDRMQDVPEDERSARYRCSLCLATPQQILHETEGTCEGEIALQARGPHGFGYDPAFGITLGTGAESEWVGKTLGEAPPEIKAQISHRSRAVRAMATYLLAPKARSGDEL